MGGNTPRHDRPVEVFHQPPRGLGTLGCAILFLGPAAVGVVMVAFQAGGVVGGCVALAAVLLSSLAIYVFFDEDATLTIDDERARLTHTAWLLGRRRRETVAWEIPIRELTSAREVTRYTPAKSGGWSTHVVLKLPRGIVIDAALFGGQAEGSVYRRLVATLEQRLGVGFTRDDDYGPLGHRPGGRRPPG